LCFERFLKNMNHVLLRRNQLKVPQALQGFHVSF
jgi:hypothetical protein